jgi:hypothetical protein
MKGTLKDSQGHNMVVKNLIWSSSIVKVMIKIATGKYSNKTQNLWFLSRLPKGKETFKK